MASRLKGNMVIGQSGGPTAVINQSLVGAIMEAKRSRQIEGVLGAVHGIKGILDEDFIDLGKESAEVLSGVRKTPAAALGSVRKKPTPGECQRIFEVFLKYDVRYFFYIGGNDSAETASIVNELARQADYEFRVVHIPKTIDNDLRVNDHCPGYGSAARFVACAFMGDDLDNRALPGIKVNVVMGRHAGFLTAASVLGRAKRDDGPHLVYVPERPFYIERFVEDVASVYGKLGRCLVAVSEGIQDETHAAVAAKIGEQARDSHGNVQLSGSGALADHVAGLLKAELGDKVRVRADTFGYLQRSFPGVVSRVDAAEAFEVGRRAVRYAARDDVDGSVVILRTKKRPYTVDYDLRPLGEVARETRSMPGSFINREGNGVTSAFVRYAMPLVGDLPVKETFSGKRLRKRR